MRLSNFVVLVVVAFCSIASARFVQAAEPENTLPADVLKALSEGKNFAVMTIDPDGVELVPESVGWQVLTKKMIVDDAARKKVVEGVKKAVETAGPHAACFNPRHAISVNYDGHAYVLLICFECSDVAIYVDRKQKTMLPIDDSAKEVLEKALEGATAAKRSEPGE